MKTKRVLTVIIFNKLIKSKKSPQKPKKKKQQHKKHKKFKIMVFVKYNEEKQKKN